MSERNEGGGSSTEAIAAEIYQYMRDRPNSAQTLESLTNWWLFRHHIRRQLALVEQAIRLLIKRGVLKEISNRSGEHLYFVRESTDSSTD